MLVTIGQLFKYCCSVWACNKNNYLIYVQTSQNIKYFNIPTLTLLREDLKKTFSESIKFDSPTDGFFMVLGVSELRFVSPFMTLLLLISVLVLVVWRASTAERGWNLLVKTKVGTFLFWWSVRQLGDYGHDWWDLLVVGSHRWENVS